MVEITDTLLAELALRAAQVRPWAYCPYSNFAVGAALLTSSGKVYEGVNVENAAYPACICAERTALVKAVSEGEREVVALAVSTTSAGAPCGQCRQMLAEFGQAAIIVLADAEGHITAKTTLTELLPRAFGPDFLR